MKSRKLLNVAVVFTVLLALVGANVGIVSADPSVGESQARNDSAESETEENDDDADNAEELKKQAKEIVTTQRKDHALIAVEDRMTLCKNRQNAIENKLSAYSNNASIILGKLDAVYEKLNTYGGSNSVAMADALDKQGKATASVEALTKLIDANKINCDVQADNAVWLTEIKLTVKSARDDLKNYRDSLKSVHAAIKGEPAVIEAANDARATAAPVASGQED